VELLKAQTTMMKRKKKHSIILNNTEKPLQLVTVFFVFKIIFK